MPASEIREHVVLAVKSCTKCLQHLPLSAFRVRPESADGFGYWCVPCDQKYHREHYQRNREKRLRQTSTYQKSRRAEKSQYDKARRAAMPPAEKKERRRQQAMRQRYGIDEAEYLVLFERQRGLCSICGEPQQSNRKTSRLYVDHCHQTGSLRGLLCNGCNVGLGGFRDNPAYLASAVNYLKRFFLP